MRAWVVMVGPRRLSKLTKMVKRYEEEFDGLMSYLKLLGAVES